MIIPLNLSGEDMFKLFVLLSIIGKVTMASELKIRFEKVRNTEGSLKYLIFKNSDGYPDKVKKSVAKGEIPTIDGNKGISVELAAGEYAVTVIHDENADGKLDTNLIGIPTEGFGFSNNPKVFFGPPTFNKTKLNVNGPTQINIMMKYY
jgi:uncharacterized protein (DUF2141 family)